MKLEPVPPSAARRGTSRRDVEPYRPAYHYTAEKNMINDPNGLFYLDGTYHLFHQYNQHEAIHWGHATSTDLVRWTHLPPAIFPDAAGQIYSGGMAVDPDNLSGLAPAGSDAPVLLAFFTSAAHQDGRQSQSVAFSLDRGHQWTMYQHNPVLPNPGLRDFRDPSVLWHEPSQSWTMLLAVGDHIEFYRSSDLLDWQFSSAWGADHGSHNGVWECPDLFEMPVRGTDRRAWVLSVSVGAGGPAGGSGMQYFVGNFDGHRFTTDQQPGQILWQNWGKDYYAGITWRNLPDNQDRTVMIAWADNWQYRFDIPTTPFNGQLTLPRELGLVKVGDGLRLTAVPAREAETLRSTPLIQGQRTITPTHHLDLPEVGDSYEIVASIDLASTSARHIWVNVRASASEHTRIQLDLARSQISVDRTASGLVPHPDFAGRHTAPVDTSADRLGLRIFVDRSCVEIFAGELVQLTDLILPSKDSRGLSIQADGSLALLDLSIYPLDDLWPTEWSRLCGFTAGEWAETRLGIQGSATAEGRAQISGDPPALDWWVEVVGSRDGNPRPILGEQAAGLTVTTTEPDRESIVELALDAQALLIRTDPAGVPTVSVPLPLEVNRRYLIGLEPVGDEIVVRLDGTTRARIAGRLSQVGLHVRNAEAIFNDAHTPGHGTGRNEPLMGENP